MTIVAHNLAQRLQGKLTLVQQRVRHTQAWLADYLIVSEHHIHIHHA